MIGGGVFAVTGLAIELTRGAVPIAFAVAGVVALLTAYSYLKLTLRYPSRGGTVEFINRAYGSGVFTGTLSILLCLSYVVLLAVYAYAFGAYGAGLIGAVPGPILRDALGSGVLVALAAVNFLSPHLVVRSENLFNVLKLTLLAAFVLAGLIAPAHWGRLAPAGFVGPWPLFSGAMIIFLNYEGFELIANAAPDVERPRRTLPIAYLGGVSIVLVAYVLIALVTVAHLDFAAAARHSDNVLAAAAAHFLGAPGAGMIALAALLATSSAINATFYGSGRLTYLIARYGELPAEFEHNIRNQPVEGLAAFLILALLILNLVPLNVIATMGSAGFLLVFAAVNLACLRLAGEVGASRILTLAGVIACTLAFVALVVQTAANPATRAQVGVLAGMIALSWFIEVVYRGVTAREVHMGHRPAPALAEPRSRGDRRP
jgi:amino acid transporter